MTGITATTAIDVDATPDAVWEALTDPAKIEQYFFGSKVTTDWQAGSPITWAGEFEGKPYEDKGEVVEADAPRRLVLTHFSPLSGQDDAPENYHRLTFELAPAGGGTHLSLSQDGNGDDEEAARAKGNWEQVLAGLKGVVEGG